MLWLVTHELRRRGYVVNHKRVARICGFLSSSKSPKAGCCDDRLNPPNMLPRPIEEHSTPLSYRAP